jgi:hypothetical protein
VLPQESAIGASLKSPNWENPMYRAEPVTEENRTKEEEDTDVFLNQFIIGE